MTSVSPIKERVSVVWSLAAKTDCVEGVKNLHWEHSVHI